MFLREFFYLHKSDRRIIIGLLCVATILIALLFVTGNEVEPSDVQQLDSLKKVNRKGTRQQPTTYYQVEGRQVERFAFDPNTADSTQLLRLGLRPWQVRNIYKYRAAGGIYREKEDFARLYGLTVKEYRELEPYIRISADYRPASTLLKDKETEKVGHDTLRFPVKLSEGQTIDLATCDTTQLRRVPGIGSYFARRIVQYREQLGGYVSLNQLDEIEDFPSDAKAYITLGATETRKLNVNKLSLNELKRHPYVNYYQARDIVDYRRKHGPLRSLYELQLLRDFPPEAIERLNPYVEF